MLNRRSQQCSKTAIAKIKAPVIYLRDPSIDSYVKTVELRLEAPITLNPDWIRIFRLAVKLFPFIIHLIIRNKALLIITFEYIISKTYLRINNMHFTLSFSLKVCNYSCMSEVRLNFR